MGMELFKFAPAIEGLALEMGELITGWESVTWVERYRSAGEFTIVCKDETIKNALPMGTFVSHVDTKEIMMVEDHQLSFKRNEQPTWTTTGRSVEAAILDNRVVGSNQEWPAPVIPTAEVELADSPSFTQIKDLIEFHIDPALVIDPDDGIQNLDVVVETSIAGTAEERTVTRGQSLYKAVQDLLAVDNLGIRTIRPSGYNTKSTLLICDGTDVSEAVAFTHIFGEIDSADYLWSIRSLKDTAHVRGKWAEVMVKGEGAGLSRRVMSIDGSDLDERYSDPPIAAALVTIRQRMSARARAALARQKETMISNVTVSGGLPQFRYRDNYNMGDIVGVHGDFQTSKKMRVIEHVEIDDENGHQEYPSLEDI